MTPATTTRSHEHDHGSGGGHGHHGVGGGHGGFDDDDDDSVGIDGQEFPLYSRPVQRQRWDEEQPHPHTNWGDTFFDLFYVAAAYNLGTLIRSEISFRGLLYFSACFFPILNIWQNKMNYDSRYYTLDDTYHRGYELCILVALATAILHIRPVNILSNPSDNLDMFIFALSVAIANVLCIGRAIEVYFNVIGEKAAKSASIREIIWFSPPIIFYTTAAIVSGLKYYNGSSDHQQQPYGYGYGDDTHGDEYYSDSGSTSYGNSSETSYPPSKNETYDTINSTILVDDDDNSTRFLAEVAAAASSSSYGSDVVTDEQYYDVPAWLCLFGAISVVVLGVTMITLCLPGGGRHKEIMIPMNINFCIHRFGEWTMLMLGESVLSLLIVDVVETTPYYKTLFSGVISITLLEYLHFRSQPHNPDDHAMRRKKEAGLAFSYTMWIYSAALIVLGTAYKMLLYEYIYEEKAKKSSNYAEKDSSYGVDEAYGYGDPGYGDNYAGYEEYGGGTNTNNYDAVGYDEYADDGHRLLQRQRSRSRMMLFGDISRALAGADDGASGYDPDRRQRIAHFFCGSMAIVWLCSDIMITIHRGLKDNLGRCRLEQHGPKKLHAMALVFVRIGLIGFIATLSQYVTEPDLLAFVGLLGILTQVALRYVGSIIFDEGDDEDLDNFNVEALGHFEKSDMSFQPKKWPNVTEAQAVSAEFKSSDMMK